MGYLTAVPISSPDRAQRIDLGHQVTRLENLGADAIVTGYRDDSGLFVSYLDLGAGARIADRLHLADRFESESRSHAFNAILYPAADGLMGLPTVQAERDSGRYPWRSRNSQITFMRFGADGALGDLGNIAPRPVPEGAEDSVAQGYSCEVSCIDWYGNARPIFIEDKAFALLGTELVESRAGQDGMTVDRRLDLTVRP